MRMFSWHCHRGTIVLLGEGFGVRMSRARGGLEQSLFF
jgi:hypothetical protein